MGLRGIYTIVRVELLNQIPGMGTSPSKSAPSTPKPKKKLTKMQSLEDIHSSVNKLRTRIDMEQPEEVEDHFATLTNNSLEVQNIRRSVKKKNEVAKCENVLRDINDVIHVIEEKRNNPRESSLDWGAVESNSFISQDVAKFVEEETLRPKKPERLQTLSQIEDKMNNLDAEIRAAVAKNDAKAYTIIEKKIHILYEDLEQVQPLENTPLSVKKQKMAAKLIRFNKKINTVKRQSQSFDSRNNSFMSVVKPPTSGQTAQLILMNVEQELSDLEVRALTFEDTEKDESYKELNRTLRENFVKLDSLQFDSKTIQRRAVSARELTKKIIQELSKKVVENEAILRKELGQIRKVEDEIAEYKNEVDCFDGNKGSEEYIVLDQKLRASWAKLNEVKCSLEKITAHKEYVIRDIQNTLRILNELSNIETVKNETLTKTKAFEKHFTELEAVLKNVNLNEHNDVYHILEGINNRIRKIMHSYDNQASFEDERTSVLNQIVSEVSIKSTDVKVISTTEKYNKIQMIQRDLDLIRGEIDLLVGGVGTEDYDAIETKLISHKHQLEEIDSAGNLTINNARVRVETKLRETYEALVEKAESNSFQKEPQLRNSVLRKSNVSLDRKSIQSINQSLDQIAVIATNVKQLEKQIEEFNGTDMDSDFNYMKQAIVEYKLLLDDIDAERYENQRLKKQEVLTKLTDLEDGLNERAAARAAMDKLETEAYSRVKTILAQVLATKKRIDCFNGTYKNVQYLSLENELEKCKADITNVEAYNKKILKGKTQGLEQIEKLLRILDERSIKTNTEDLTYHQFEVIRTKLTRIKTQMENFRGDSKDEQYYEIITDLNKCNDEVNNIEEHKRASTTNSKVQYLQYIQDLLKYFNEKTGGEKSGLAQENQTTEDAQLHSDVNNSMFEIEKIYKDLEDFKKDVNNFSGDKTDPRYNDFNKNITNLKVKLDRVDTYKRYTIRNKRKDILKILDQISNELENKSSSTNKTNMDPNQARILQDIENITKELDEINDKIRQFNGNKNDPLYTELDEKLINLFLKLDHINVNNDNILKTEKMKASKEVERNLQLLEGKTKTALQVDFEAEGTDV